MKITTESIRLLEQWFDEALDLDPVAREAMIARCGEQDAQLGAELAKLIARDQHLLGSKVPSALGLVEAGLDALDSDALKPGATIGVYRLEQEIGQGGMGRVFRATRTGPDFSQEVAIKFVRRDLVHPALLRRFSTERAILAALDHPGISRLIDANTTPDGTPYVVMEFVRGDSIDTWADTRKLGIRDRLHLFRKVLAAVAHAHRNLVVHRDIKANNVLVTDEGETRLLDFGIAKPLGRIGNVNATLTIDRFLTPSSAAPEQLIGGPITIACDIHALGMLLYEFLCGRLPFAFGNMTPGEIEQAIRQMPPPPMASRIGDGDIELARQRGCNQVRELRAGVRGDLEHIVQRCLRKRPEERYGTVDQLDLDIDHVLRGQPIRERQNDHWYRWRKLIARHRVASALSAILLITVIGALVAILLQNVTIGHERDRAQRAVSLLKNAFAAANPTEIAGAHVTARQVLEAARPSLEVTFDTQPDVYADLAGTLAEVELAVGLSPRASELAQRATAAAEKAGLGPATIAQLALLEARARTSAGDYDLAEKCLERSARLGADRSAEWKLAQGTLLLHRNRIGDAIPVLHQAVEMLRQSPPSDDTARQVKLQYAEALRRGDRAQESLAQIEDLLAWQRAGLANDHPRLTLIRLYRIDALRAVRRTAEAVTEANAVIAEADRAFGPYSTVAAHARASLGVAQNELGQHAAAASAFRESLAAWRSSVGDDHQNTLRTEFNLAMVLTDGEGNDDEAEALFREVVAKSSQGSRATRLPLVYWRSNLARFLLARKRAPEALAVLLEAEGISNALAASEKSRTTYLATVTEAATAAGCRRQSPQPLPAICAEAESVIVRAQHDP